ncbi:MOSC domain-containing protein [Nemania serpens]|nr:MOSC domain-containing protein [Nemania serpens]
MKITQLYIYPIKSLAPLSVSRTRLGREGLEHDRRFMLLKVKPDGTYKKIQIPYFPECALFHQRLDGDEIVVTYHAPEAPEAPEPLRVPLSPKLEGRGIVDVSLNGSGTVAYRMGDPYDGWFTARFGYEVILVYIGDQGREVLAHRPSENPLWRQQRPRGGWLSSIAAYLPGVGGGDGNASERLTFSEVAPFLVTSGASLRDVSKRLPDGEEMDIRRFRPNIVVDEDPQAAPEKEGLKAWEEDYWAELSVSREARGGEEHVHRFALTMNCGRCISINIDYDTGRPAEGEPGIMLKKLMADRRVDEGNKYSPIFGRYGFLLPEEGQDHDDGVEVAVGDEIRVTKRLDYRDRWAWPM